MPEKSLDKGLFTFLVFIAFLTSFANALAGNKHLVKEWKDILLQTFIGGVSGIVFGLLGCWLLGENIYAVGSFAGIGAVLSINGLRYLAMLLKRYLENRIK